MVGKLTNKMLFVGKMWNLHVNTPPPLKYCSGLATPLVSRLAVYRGADGEYTSMILLIMSRFIQETYDPSGRTWALER